MRAAITQYGANGSADYSSVLGYVALEAVLVAALAGTRRGLDFCQSLLQILLGQRVNIMILDKALTLDLAQFEDSEFYDKLNRARQEASSRPLSLVNRTFSLIQNGISLTSYAIFLWRFSPWAVGILLVAGLPVFFAEAKFSGERFRVFRWRSPLRRMLLYLEIVLARDDHAKEVKLFNLGPGLMERYRAISESLYQEQKELTKRRDTWGFALGLVSNVAVYLAYAWVAVSTVTGAITLGKMTMYMSMFKQGQSGVSSMLSAIGGMYEDNLYLSNLYDYLEQPRLEHQGQFQQGPDPAAGIRFEHVTFTYPGAAAPAVEDVSLTLRPGQSVALVGHNGSGKTTIVKLMAGLYRPDSGRISYQGLDLDAWDRMTLRQHIAVIFQDFNRYQLKVGENIGVGDVTAIDETKRWSEAAHKGQAAAFIESLPEQYETQLGRWFNKGQELSGGQWQRIALARAFMRKGAEILVLDEPTSSMDAETEAEIFEHFQSLTEDKIAILISHRFSTVRRADHIIVMDHGHILEEGGHDELVALGGRYAKLFELQARAYR